MLILKKKKKSLAPFLPLSESTRIQGKFIPLVSFPSYKIGGMVEMISKALPAVAEQQAR